jgi:predicted ribonuclease toxin of YeeF-YezG toxin-antitoxin module
LTDVAVSVVEIHKDTGDIPVKMSDVVNSNKQAAKQKELQSLLDWLGASDPSVRHNDLRRKRAEDTGN